MENKNNIENELENVVGGAGINNVYTIKPGDTLQSIANQFHSTVDMLMYLNPSIKSPYLISIGQVIRIR